MEPISVSERFNRPLLLLFLVILFIQLDQSTLRIRSVLQSISGFRVDDPSPVFRRVVDSFGVVGAGLSDFSHLSLDCFQLTAQGLNFGSSGSDCLLTDSVLVACDVAALSIVGAALFNQVAAPCASPGVCECSVGIGDGAADCELDVVQNA